MGISLVFLQSSPSVPVPGIVDSIEALHQRRREHLVSGTASEVAIAIALPFRLTSGDHQFAHLVFDPTLELRQESVLQVLLEVGEIHDLCRQKAPRYESIFE